MKKINLLLASAILAVIVFSASCSKSDKQNNEETPQITTQQVDYHFVGVKTVDTLKTKGVALRSKLWSPGTHITIKFLNGTDAQIAKVKSVAAEWLEHANIYFDYVTASDALVRIAIGENRYISWSTIGTDCKGLQNQNEATMNLAFSSYLDDDLIKGDILRSFGQMLGLELEHRHINVVKSWNSIEEIKAWWSGNYSAIPWETFKMYVVDPINDIDIPNLEQIDYDENSIMLWEFPNRPPVVVFNEGYKMKTSFNTALSAKDKDFINKLYTAGERYIILSPLEYTVGSTGGSFPLTVKSNTTWTLTKPDWCTISASSGSNDATVIVTIADNGGLKTDREGLITGTIPDRSTSVKVKQTAQMFATVSPTNFDTDYKAKEFNLTISSNTSWTLTSQDWCKVTPSSGSGNETVKVSILENSSTSDRENLITSTIQGGITSTCKVKQTGKTFATISPATFDTDFTAKDFNITITSNTNWTLTSSQDWCKVTPISGSGNATIKVSLTENALTTERQGDITCTFTGGSTSSTVKQTAKPFITASPATNEAEYTLTSYNLNVTSNTAWTLSTSTWCTLTPASGSGNAVVKVTISENPSTSERQDAITGTISSGSYIISQYKQKGKPFVTLAPTTFNIDKSARNLNLTVTSNTSWTLNASAGCTVKPASGTGNATVEVSVPENTTTNDRSFTITPYQYGTNSCTIFQSGRKFVNFSLSNINSVYSKSDYILDITANTPWTLTAPSWCTLSASSGSGNAKITVTVLENGTLDPRNGNITATHEAGTTTCSITQTTKPVWGGKVNVIVYFKNNYIQPVSVNGNYRVQLGASEINFSCSKTLPANSSDNRVEVGSGTITNRDFNALQNLNIGFSSWSSPSLPTNPTTLISTRITGDLSGNFQGSTISGNPAGKYNATNITWKTSSGVMGAATLEIVYGIGSPGEDW